MGNPESGGQTEADGYMYPDFPAPQQPAPKVYDPHPLFPRDDGKHEDEDIQFVSFLRRLPDGVKHCPVDFPSLEMQNWEQVVELWGGGDYQAIAKDQNHRVLRHYPTANKWYSFDGEPKPMTKPPRPGTPIAQSPRLAEAPSAVAAVASVATAMPPGIADLVASVVALVNEVRETRAAPTTPPQGNNDTLLAMMNNQAILQAAQIKAEGEVRAAQVKADAEARAAQAKAEADARIAQAQATTENNKFLLGLMTRGGGGEDKLASLLALLKPYLQPPSAPPQQDVLGLLERAKQLFPQVAPAAASEFKPIADMVGGIMTQSLAADAKKAEAAADLRKAELQAGRASEGPAPRRDREPPPLVHVTGLGMVHVVAPEATLTHAPAPPAAPAAAPPAPQAPTPPVAPAAAPPAAHAPAPPPAPSASVAVAVLPGASVAPAAPVELGLPPSAQAVVVSSVPPDAPAPPPVVAAAPRVVAETEPAVAMPAEVRAVVEQVAQQVTDDDRAALAGQLGRLSTMSSAERVKLLQSIFPLMSSGDADQAVEMMLHLPMLDISRMLSHLPPADILQAKRALGLDETKTPEK